MCKVITIAFITEKGAIFTDGQLYVDLSRSKIDLFLKRHVGKLAKFWQSQLAFDKYSEICMDSDDSRSNDYGHKSWCWDVAERPRRTNSSVVAFAICHSKQITHFQVTSLIPILRSSFTICPSFGWGIISSPSVSPRVDREYT